jgi:rfaE bifunctional protein kinase chain/domain
MKKPTPRRLEELLTRMKKMRVLVVGDVGIDRYTTGLVERVSPEAPVPIVLVTSEVHKMGLAANVTDNVHALGAKSDLIGVIGKDRFAGDFKDLLKTVHASTRGLVEDSERRTIVKERIVSDRQQVVRVDYETLAPVSAKIEKEILKRVQTLLKQSDILILQDYAKGMLSPELVKKVFSAAKKARVPVAVDPNAKSPLALYVGATFLTPNTREAEKLAGIDITDEKSLKRVGEKILKMTKAKHVVITLGKDGMAVFNRGQKQVQMIPTFAREVYDVSGAGDTVISIMALAYAAEGSIEESAILGNLGAGVVVGKRGTATVNHEEILTSLELARMAGVL